MFANKIVKSFTKCAFAAAAVSLFAVSSFAQSSKATAAINTAVDCTFTATTTINDPLPATCADVFTGAAIQVEADNFIPIMSAPMKVSNSQSIFVSPSLVTGLYTNTTTKTHTGSTSTSVAAGSVYMRAVLKDPNTGAVLEIADPVAICTNDILGCQASSSGDFGVTLDSRVQTLSQTLSACVVTVDTGAAGTCSFDSTIQLILQTTSAHTFNFIFPNVGVGNYNVVIEVAVNSGATTTSGTAVGAAAFGLGSMTVESVRLVHGFSF